MKDIKKTICSALPLMAAAVPCSQAAAYAAGPAAADRAGKQGQRPNIIYIMTDQQCATAMSCAGNTDLSTPNMDRLAEHGIMFTNAYCDAAERPCQGCHVYRLHAGRKRCHGE